MLKNRIVSMVSTVAAAFALLLTSNAGAQCEPAWSALGSGAGGFSTSVHALTVFDDGSGAGPALYAGGSFTTAGGVTVNHIAKWDGAAWSALGSGMSGTDPELTKVSALTVFDDGSGPALYAGGEFTRAGGVAAQRIAKWDGAAWSALGSGVSSGAFTRASVQALTVFDDGSGAGPALYAGGNFNWAGGVGGMRNIAKWDGAAWSAVGSGLSMRAVLSLTVFDDGSGAGSALYAGGVIASTSSGVGANGIAKWDGAAWSGLGSGMSGSHSRLRLPFVGALAALDDGSGAGLALYAGGNFITAGGVTANHIAQWDGAAWSALGSGMDDPVSALRVFDDGSGGGAALYAGGQFTTAGGVGASRIAKWDGAAWSALGSGLRNDSIPSVHALTVFDDSLGGGRALYAGGFFDTAGGVSARNIAKWGISRVCYADCDCSGALDFFDFLCFQDEFAAGSAYADCDDSGAHDFFDFLCFQNAFAAGCP